jgi:acyl-CoA synthetase (AMP-forming)/AMP-acid ligase II
MVSRHFDFLENLLQESRLSVEPDVLKNAMRRVEFLLGSAPVGPFTVGRLQRYTGRVPIVRFGSTETCLQVIGTPLTLSEKQTLAAFRRGWFHQWNGEKHPGYYVGRPHPPYTECRIVRSVMPGSPHYFVDCEEGEPGYLIARGGNVMQKYVKNDVDTHKVLHDGGWYTGFGDICFWRADDADAKRDYYWVSRESALLIRGGANYAYAQVNSELKEFVKKRYGLPYEAFDVAVVGLRLQSEHEDDCCVFMELLSPEAVAKQDEIEKTFLTEAQANVSKGARPDRLLFQKIPRNYKGEIVVPQLKKAYSQLSDIGS